MTDWVPSGHFYSPIPSLKDVRDRESEIFACPDALPGIDLNAAGQVTLFRELARYYDELPFKPEKQEGLRYAYENPNFSYADAMILYAMIRHARPKRIIEIGSGYSSCVTLDTNERFFGNAIDCTFIEPYPELLHTLIRPSDRESTTIIATRLQEVGTDVFAALDDGDILFIDSTHVSKIDSDVNHILFRILPMVKPGVYIHIHDIFYPFEYPKDWVLEGRAWNENYILRAFLQYNDSFRIVFFNSWFARYERELLQEKMPLALKNTGGSIWLRKTAPKEPRGFR